MITRFMLRMFAEFPEPDGLICTLCWIFLVSLFSRDAWRAEE